jgi:hypothetical protein
MGLRPINNMLTAYIIVAKAEKAKANKISIKASMGNQTNPMLPLNTDKDNLITKANSKAVKGQSPMLVGPYGRNIANMIL